MSNEFQPDNNGNIFRTKSKIIRHPIIKSNEVNIKQEKKFIPQTHHTDTKKTKVSPIMNDNEIIGVMTECSCGEVIKIYFNYESGNETG